MKTVLGKLGMCVALPVLALLPGKKAAAMLQEAPEDPHVANMPEIRDNTPLYLEHVRNLYGDGSNIQSAGHRSHSSHRSHYSSSSGPSVPYTAPESVPPPQPERLTPRVKPSTQDAGTFRGAASAEDFIKKGMAESRAGRYQEAVSLYAKAIALEPLNFMAHNNLGVAYFKKGNKGAALSSIRRALEINSDYGDARYNLAVVLQEEGKEEDAKVEFQKACDQGISDACSQAN